MKKAHCINCQKLGYPKYYNKKNYCETCFYFAKLLRELEHRTTMIANDVKDALLHAKMLQEGKGK